MTLDGLPANVVRGRETRYPGRVVPTYASGSASHGQVAL